jgi:hydantoinase/carbamoylase family amidase
MNIQKVNQKNIEQHFDALSKIGNLGDTREEGFLRTGWSDEESAAFQYIREIAESKGLIAEEDAVGNLFLKAKACEGDEVVQIGSHLDTVPRGGLFDGGAGIVAGLEAILAALRSGEVFTANPELVIWRCEESANWRAVCIGSRAALGQNPPSILDNRIGEQTLRDAIRAQGFDPSPMGEQRPTLSNRRLSNIRAHLELHIEQSIQLERTGKEIGVVTSIRGTRRSRIVVRGEAAHSGGTPMGTEYRQDANLAMALIQTRLNELCCKEIERGADLVQTVGVVNSDKNFNAQHPEVYENALTKVSPFGYFSLDCRSNDRSFLHDYEERAHALVREVAQELHVEAEIKHLTALEPMESVDQKIQQIALEACDACGYSSLELPSGALHDAAIIGGHTLQDGTHVPIGMLFIPCRNGISHNPLEYASTEAVTQGANVLARMLVKLCR